MSTQLLPCDAGAFCPPCYDPPILNLSSEAPDNPQVSTTVTVIPDILLGDNIHKTTGTGTGTTPPNTGTEIPKPPPVGTPPPPVIPPPPDIIIGTNDGNNPNPNTTPDNNPIRLYWNGEIPITVPCGEALSPYCFVDQYNWKFAAHQIQKRSVLEANAVAESLGKQQANFRKICFFNDALVGCLYTDINFRISIANGNRPFTWQLLPYLPLPNGLYFEVDPNDQFAWIRGVPTEGGQGAVDVQVTDPDGGYTVHRVPWFILGITSPHDIPPFTVGMPYSYQFTADGWSSDLRYAVSSGGFPPGITLSDTGLLSGTALANVNAFFSLSLTSRLPADPCKINPLADTDKSCFYDFLLPHS